MFFQMFTRQNCKYYALTHYFRTKDRFVLIKNNSRNFMVCNRVYQCLPRCCEKPLFSTTDQDRHLFSNIAQTAPLFSKALKDDLPDMHPEKGKMVYVGSLSNMVKMIKGFSITTSGVALAFQPMLFQAASEIEMSNFLKFAVGGFMNFFIFFTPVMLHWITKRYVSHIYYNAETETFYANTYTILLRDKEHIFTADDVKHPEIAGIFTTFKAKNQPLFVDPSFFMDKEAYIKMMGYDKPFDWGLSVKDEKEGEKENENSSNK